MNALRIGWVIGIDRPTEVAFVCFARAEIQRGGIIRRDSVDNDTVRVVQFVNAFELITPETRHLPHQIF